MYDGTIITLSKEALQMNKCHCMLLWALLMVLSHGCAFEKDFARDATLYNKTVERVGNELLLLNILRAKERRPMYFTGFTQIRGNRSGSVSSKAAFPFGGGDGNSYTGDLSGSISSSPSFDLAVLDSQKFISGITAPISSELLKYYWDQGWPREMLLYLCVREIRITKDGETTTYVNNVWDGKFENFQTFVRLFAYFEMEENISDSFRWPSFKLNKLSIKDLVNIKEAGLVISPPVIDVNLPRYDYDKKKWSVQWFASEGQTVAVGDPLIKYRSGDDEDFRYLKAEINGTFRLNPDIRPKPEGYRIGRIEEEKIVQLMKRTTSIQFVPPKSTSEEGVELFNELRLLEAFLIVEGTTIGFDVDADTTLILRSPEGMLYYLGELVRAYHMPDPTEKKKQAFQGDLLMVKGGGSHRWPLFVVESEKTHYPDNPVIEVTLDDTLYFIMPSGGEEYQSGRSLHCLSFVSLMIGLHKSADELPKTQSVTVVGR